MLATTTQTPPRPVQCDYSLLDAEIVVALLGLAAERREVTHLLAARLGLADDAVLTVVNRTVLRMSVGMREASGSGR